MLATVGAVLATWVLTSPTLGLEAQLRGWSQAELVSPRTEDANRPPTEIELRPALTGRLFQSDDSFALTYAPRLFLRLPNTLGRPLVLHRGSLEHTHAFSSRFAWLSSAQLAAGEIDYVRFGQLFDSATTPGEQPSDTTATDVLHYAELGITSGPSLSLTRRLELRAALSASQIGGPLLGTTASLFRARQRLALDVGAAYAATRSDTLALELGGELVRYDPSPTYRAVSPLVGWSRSGRGDARLSVRAGVTVAYATLDPRASSIWAPGDSLATQGTTARSFWFPLAEVAGRTTLFERRTFLVRSAALLAIQRNYDPIRATLEPSGTGSVELSFERPPAWALRLEGRGVILRERGDAEALGQGPTAWRAFTAARAVLAYAASEQTSLEAGVTWDVRTDTTTPLHPAWDEHELRVHLAFVIGTPPTQKPESQREERSHVNDTRP